MEFLSTTPAETNSTNLPKRFSFTTQNDAGFAPSPARGPPVIYHCVASLHRPDGDVVSITATKEFVFVGSESGRIHTWKLPECPGTEYIKVNYGQVRAMVACGRILFSSHGDCRVRMWEMKVGKSFKPEKMATFPPKRSFFMPRKSVHLHKDVVSCLAYNVADKLLYTGSWDCTVKAWNITETRCVDSFTAHERPINAIVINQQDGFVFTCSSDGTIKIWRRIFGQNSHILTMILTNSHLSPINALALSFSSSPKTSFLYSASSNGLIDFWQKESSSGRYSHGGFLQGHSFAVLCLATVKEDLILSGSEDSAIRVWRREKGSFLHCCVAVIDGHFGPVISLAVAPESDEMGNLVVCSASLDRSFKVWRVRVFAGEIAGEIPGEDCICGLEKKGEMKEIGGCESDEMNPVLSPSWVERRKLQGKF